MQIVHNLDPEAACTYQGPKFNNKTFKTVNHPYMINAFELFTKDGNTKRCFALFDQQNVASVQCHETLPPLMPDMMGAQKRYVVLTPC